MVDAAERLSAADSEPALLAEYARALATGEGDRPHPAGELRRAFLSRRRALRAASSSTPPPPPRAARTPRISGRLAKQPRLHKQRSYRRLTTTTIVVIVVVAGMRVFRSCDRIKERFEGDRGGVEEQMEKPPIYGIGGGGAEPEEPEEAQDGKEREDR